MGIIPQTKIGDCCLCNATNTMVVKRQKDLYCLSCKRKIDTKKQVQKANERFKVRSLANTQNSISPEQVSLEKWFEKIKQKHSSGLGAVCMECGAYIPQQYMRHATAHLLPKKNFLSVATHELNYLILGAGCGCHVRTDRLDLFVKMKVWPEAARRIKIMMPLLPFDELKYISSQLLAELDKVK